MAVGTVWQCASLPTWDTADCCGGCHSAVSDVRPARTRWPQGYLPPLIPAGGHKVLCCRATWHAMHAMRGVPVVMGDSLDLPPVPPAEDPDL